VKKTTKWRVSAAVVLAGVVGVMATATSAYALDEVDNIRLQTLADAPATNAHSCIDRHIYLAGHTYSWYLVQLDEFLQERTITLATGWYQWTDCLSYAGPHEYQHHSQLDPDSSAYVTVSLDEPEYMPPDSGSVTTYWGSTLLP